MLAQPRGRRLLLVFVGVLVGLTAERQPDRRAGHIKIGPQPIDKISFIRIDSFSGLDP